MRDYVARKHACIATLLRLVTAGIIHETLMKACMLLMASTLLAGHMGYDIDELYDGVVEEDA